MDLTLFGWNPFFEAAFASWKEQGFIRARVAMEDKHAYVVLTEQGDMSASVSGKLLHDRSCNADLPKVGDWVAVAVVAGEGKAIIQGVLPRRTRLARRLPGREVQEQVLAANIETAFVVQALDSSFNRRQLERFLVMVHEGGAKPVVVLNKTDLCDSLEARVGEARLAARSAPVVAACAKTGPHRGRNIGCRLHRRALERHLGELVGVEEVGRAEVGVALGVVGIDAGRLDRHLEGALGRLAPHDRACSGKLIEPPRHPTDARVLDPERGRAVGGVHDVLARRRRGRCRRGRGRLCPRCQANAHDRRHQNNCC